MKGRRPLNRKPTPRRPQSPIVPPQANIFRGAQNADVSESGLDSVESFQQLRSWGISKYDLPPPDLLPPDFSLQDHACAALFAFAAWELNSKRNVITRTKIEGSVKQYTDAANLCRSTTHYDYLHSANPNLDAALSIVSWYFQDQARKIGQMAGPHVIKRSSKTRGDDETRIHVRALATETHRLFGSFLYGTVATVVTVGLEIKPAISAKSVENWCSGLLSQ
ncbi:MAG TPA: hypothetical protein VGP28_03005 [Methylocella sp.]|nr:hypothetical protein [Methylocella sp.]